MSQGGRPSINAISADLDVWRFSVQRSLQTMKRDGVVKDEWVSFAAGVVPGIKARRTWRDSREKYDLLRLFSEGSEKFPVYVLQTIALMRKASTKGRDLLRLSPKDFETDWNKACESIEETLKRIRLTKGDGFGVLEVKRLPYVTMVPVLGALLNEIEYRQDRPQCLTKIRNWYWSSVLAHAYSGSTETQIALDFREMMVWFDSDDKIPSTVAIARTYLDEVTDLYDVTNTSDALYKGITCIFALRGGQDFVRTDIVDLSVLDDHHIFPLSRAAELGAGPEIESILNKTLLHKETNRDYISNNKPSEYLSRIAEDQNLSEDEIMKRLATHLISSEAYGYMKEDDFQKFLAKRDETIKTELRELIGKQ